MLFNINAETSKASVEIAKIKVKAVLAELFIKYFLEEYNYQAFSDIPEWLDKLCLEMKRLENLAGGVKTMQVLAPCTPEHLCKVFRKHMSMTPTDFINEQKLNYAAKRLADSDDKIYSISTDLGFKSLSRFYNIFRKHYGVSPAKYRIIARKTDIPL
jgi:AraC family cel operon transcriptional repressor